MKFSETLYRDCGYCRTKDLAMTMRWSSRRVPDAAGRLHLAAALSCPRCGRVTILELRAISETSTSDGSIHPMAEVEVLSTLPNAEDLGVSVRHLPDDVKAFYNDAQRVLLAGVPDAAAVQLRKTLEAAAAHKGIQERNLVEGIRKLVDAGHVTLDFKDVMTHIRKIGNSGAHAGDIRLTGPEVERSLRFTTQVLRNLFEVPGELAELSAETPGEDLAESNPA